MLKVKRNELFGIWNALYLLKDKGDKSLTFYTQRNLALLEDEIKSLVALQDSAKPSKEFLEFDDKRLALGKEMSKDENGEPVIEDGKYIFTEEKQKEWQDAFVVLTTEYQEVITEQDKTVNELNALLDEEIEVEFRFIPFALIPEDMNYNAISKIIKETEDEVEAIILGNLGLESKDDFDKSTKATPAYPKA